MSTVFRDLWPKDIGTDDVVSPEDILKYQGKLLGEKTNGVLSAEVVRHESEDQVVLGFEVFAPRADVRARLFTVQHRARYEYPAAIIPPDEELPPYLRDQVYRPSVTEKVVGGLVAKEMELMKPGQWVGNQWVASSPRAFSEKVQAVLSLPTVKAIVLSLLSRSKPPETSSAGNES